MPTDEDFVLALSVLTPACHCGRPACWYLFDEHGDEHGRCAEHAPPPEQQAR